jgi:hypothetical protein
VQLVTDSRRHGSAFAGRACGLDDKELDVVVVRREALRASGRDVRVAADEAPELCLERGAQRPRRVFKALRLVHLCAARQELGGFALGACARWRLRRVSRMSCRRAHC